METKPKTLPVKQCRVAGITASIWKREHDSKTFYSVSIDRSYKVEDTWKRTSSVAPDELPVVADLAKRAEDFLAGRPA